MAKELECDESEKAFDEKLKKVAKKADTKNTYMKIRKLAWKRRL